MEPAIQSNVTHLPVQRSGGGDLIESAYSVQNVLNQVKLVQDVMHSVMRENEHYGVIQGTNKPTLLKSGAEKLNMVFRLSPSYEIKQQINESTFINYTVECRLTHSPSNTLVATGLGSCNSKEAKYRFRYIPTNKKPDKQEAATLKAMGIGKWKKQDNAWIWMERVENDNAWDFDNTLLKMACKRALVAATLNALSVSDIFTQDMEDLQHLMETEEQEPQQPDKPEATDAEIEDWCFNIAQSETLEALEALRANAREFVISHRVHKSQADLIAQELEKRKAVLESPTEEVSTSPADLPSVEEASSIPPKSNPAEELAEELRYLIQERQGMGSTVYQSIPKELLKCHPDILELVIKLSDALMTDKPLPFDIHHELVHGNAIFRKWFSDAVMRFKTPKYNPYENQTTNYTGD